MTAPSHIVESEPQCLTLRDAIATRFELIALDDAPGQPASARGSKAAHTRGCLYDADGRRVDLSIRPGDIDGDQSMSVDPELLPPEQRGGTWLPGRALYLGPFMNRYGSFITESLSRYWREEAAAFDHFVAYPFVYDHGEIHLQEFHRYLAGLLGVPLERMAVLRSQTVFDEIVVPEQLWTHDVHVNSRMRAVYGRIRARHAGQRANGRLFLSSTSSLRLGNVAGVEEIFASFGFRVLYPEHIPIADQLSLYANCAVLAGLGGGGMHNCLFARPGLMTIEVGDARARQQPVLAQRIANELSQVDARFITFGEDNDIRISPRKLRRQLVDILGERPRLGPLVALHLKRRLRRLIAKKEPARPPHGQADLRGGS